MFGPWLHRLIFLLMVLSSQARAQDIKAVPPNPESNAHSSLAHELFEAFDGPIMLQGVLEAPFTYLYLGDPNIHGLVYAPSFAPRLGPRLSWKNLGATVTFALPIPENERYRRGVSPQTDLLLNSYWRQNAMDLYYQKFRGFYVSSPGRELSTHKPARYPQLPDAALLSFGVNWYYAAHPESYSLRAAFDCTEFQLKSGGSWLLNPFYNHLEVSLGNRFIPGIGDQSIQGVPNLSSGRFDSLGAAFGYGFTTISDRYFASLLGAVGPGLQIQHIQRSDGGDDRAFNIAWKINVNASLGWNSRLYVGGLKLLFDSLSSRVSEREVATNLVSGEIFFGGRF